MVKLSDRVEVEWFRQVSPTGCIEFDETAVSCIGTMAARAVATYRLPGKRPETASNIQLDYVANAER